MMVEALHAPLQTLKTYVDNNANNAPLHKENSKFQDIIKSEMNKNSVKTTKSSNIKAVIKNNLYKINPNKAPDPEEVKAFEEMYNSFATANPQKSKEISLNNFEHLNINHPNGTKIALEKDMWEYAKFIEKKLRVIMMGFAFKPPKLEEGPNIFDLLYSDEYIEKKVDEIFGVEGGDLARDIMDKFQIDYADLIQQEPNNEKRINKKY
jgi:hypothetical protein